MKDRENKRNEENLRIVSAGHICLDITPLFPETGRSYERVEEVFKPGQLLKMEGVNLHTGGSVANTGLALKRFGADVTLMGKIGDDEFGFLVKNMLKKEGITDGMIVEPKGRTSYSAVLAVPGIDRIFLHDSGANESFSEKDLDYKKIGTARHFHFGYPPLMKRMYEDKGEELSRMFAKCKELGLSTSLDMAAVDEASPAGRADWEEILRKTLPYVDFFVPSAEEILFMTERKAWERVTKIAGKEDFCGFLEEALLTRTAEKLLGFGAKAVLIKCGKKGMYFKSRSGFDGDSEWNNKAFFQPAFQPKRVVSATGAGDTSIAAFLTAMLLGEAPEEAAAIGAAAGAACVESYDALSGLVSYGELKKRSKEQREEKKL